MRLWRWPNKWPTRLWLAALLVLGGAGTLAYRHTQVRRLGQDVYYELEGDSLPPMPGVLDDPVFADLPPAPAGRPESWGRYRPPAQPSTPREAGSGGVPMAPQGPESVQASGSDARAAAPAGPASADPAPSNPAPNNLAPASFTERLKTNARLRVLLIGNDQAALGEGRADVLVVSTFDPVDRQLTFLSVPRDTRVQIPEHDGLNKINAAYALGGPTLQTLTVERFLGLPMDKFVEVSMDGFQRVIDLVGGVEVNPPFAFELDGQAFRPGPVRLSGEQALAYSRMRKEDPRGDLGRNARQQEVLRSLMAALGQRSPEELSGLLEELRTQVHTNFSLSEVVELRRYHSYALDHQRSLQVAGTNERIDGLWYYAVTDTERQRLHLALR